MFINTHTHQQLYDAQVELVSLAPGAAQRTSLYSYGLHPWHLGDDWKEKLELLETVVREPHCLAVGECGIDKVCKVSLDLQLEAFAAQVALANSVKKPLIIHCVKGFNELINCLNSASNKVPVIIHGFNNNENIARVMLDEGYYFSFGKALLGYESNAARAIRSVGRRNFFLETDDADISIKYIYRKAAELLGIDENILQEQLRANFEKVFNYKPSVKT